MRIGEKWRKKNVQIQNSSNIRSKVMKDNLEVYEGNVHIVISAGFMLENIFLDRGMLLDFLLHL